MEPKITISIELTAEEFNIIIGALDEVPGKYSRRIANKLEVIAKEQINGPTLPETR